MSLLGTLALGLLVWYAGDLVSIGGKVPLASPSRRVLVIAGLVVVWAITQVIAAARARRRDRGLIERLVAAQPEEPAPVLAASADELAALEKRFQDAFRLLKSRKARSRLGGRALSQLPWYLIIGPPGCGKTTALLNSGLSFPLAEDIGQGPVHGVGGTRSCDWWLTKDAVLIDTAGRYTTQDSYEQVDRRGWESFLALLKKYRPQRPINGVFVAISLADVLQQSATERDAQVRAIGQRLQELHDAFKIRIPVYLLVMKADLIAGFTEFFADLGKTGREQVWGTTLPLPAEAEGAAPVEHLHGEVAALLDKLSERRIARMGQERDPGKRVLIFAFPQQFAELEAPLGAFVRDIFRRDRYRIPPVLRGLYFTSGTQTGTPIDRVMANVAASVGFAKTGQQPFKGTGRGYFLTRLFRDLVLLESGLAGFDPRLARRRYRRRATAFVGILGLCVLAAAAWTTSYIRNQANIEAIEKAVKDAETELAALDPAERDATALLPLLDRARAIPGGHADRDQPAAILSSLGLDQGKKLGPAAQRAYRRILQTTLLPLVMLRLEDQIRGANGDPERLYDALRVYLMLDDPTRYDAEMVRYWIGRDWDRSLPQGAATEQQREALKDHLQALLEERPAPPPFALDSALITKARETLTQEPLAERLYDRIKGEGLGPGFAELTLSDAAGDYAKLVFERRSGRSLNEGIHALYTFDGYHHGFDAKLEQLIAATAEDSWILGSETDLEPGSESFQQLVSDVRRPYLRDYVAAWDDLIQDIDIIRPRDLRHAAEIARMLADPDQSPLRRLLLAMMAQTALDRQPEAEQPASDAERPAPNAFRERVDRYFDAKPPERAGLLDSVPEDYVTRRFDWLPDLMQAKEGQPTAFDRVQAALDRASLLLKSMAAAASTDRGALAAGEAAEIDGLKEVAEDLPGPLSGLLTRLAQDSADIISGGMRAQLNRLWTAEILPFCREAIHDRYPFESLSTRETTLHDFARMFSPDGLLDAFFKEHLSQLVDVSQQPWKWNGPGIGIPDGVLEQFQRAVSIRQAFFGDQKKLPAVQMELAPIALDSQARELILELGGQVVEYRGKSTEAHALTWPSPIAPGRAGIEFVNRIGTRPSLRFSGPWAWFRLLDAAQMEATDQADIYRLAFTVAEHEAQFELRAASVRNPFGLDELRGFRCPDRL